MQNRQIQRALIIGAAFMLIAGACTFPFTYESPSMFYKLGFDRLLLQTGKVAGIIAFTLVILQPVLTARFRFLENLFGLKQLMKFHRINALLLLAAAIVHPILVLASNQFVLFPLELRYWPEFTGVLLLILLGIAVAVSYWQKPMGIRTKTWIMTHRFITPVIVLVLFLHVMNVSETFESNVPFYTLVALAVLTLILFIKKYAARLKNTNK